MMRVNDEKRQLPVYRQEKRDFDNRAQWKLLAILVSPFALLITLFFTGSYTWSDDYSSDFDFSDLCPQVAPLVPDMTEDVMKAYSKIETIAYSNQSQNILSKSVRIPTVSFDDLGPVGVDERWNTRYEFHTWLESTFPLVHAKLQVEKVNTFGLVYTWQGSNASLKPTLLMAHQDVVPVPDQTIKAWTYPPFSGHFDGEYVWGRGSSDCKNQLTAILESVTLLMETGWSPKRTLILSFGFDEEISGGQGAGTLAPFLLERYGRHSFAVVVDEGNGFSQAWGTQFASPAVSEKGHLNVEVTIRMPGGHSSVPSDHTAIGVAAELIQMIENDQYMPKLNEGNPFLSHLQCGAAHSPKFPSKYKALLRKSHSLAKLALEAAKESLFVKYLMTTSIAVDTIRGGVKVNALPEQVDFVINHRINIGEHTKDVEAKILKHTRKVAKKHHLDVFDFSTPNTDAQGSSIALRSNNVLEPAPLTNTAAQDSAYAVLSGTTRGLFGEEVIMSPGIMTGNTDTRYYWALAKDIFRFNPARGRGDEGMGRIHTVDERMGLEGHLESIKFFFQFVLNMDSASLE